MLAPVRAHAESRGAHIRFRQRQDGHGSSFGGDKLYLEGLPVAVTVHDRAHVARLEAVLRDIVQQHQSFQLANHWDLQLL
jgi:hypothetical protein